MNLTGGLRSEKNESEFKEQLKPKDIENKWIISNQLKKATNEIVAITKLKIK